MPALARWLFVGRSLVPHGVLDPARSFGQPQSVGLITSRTLELVLRDWKKKIPTRPALLIAFEMSIRVTLVFSTHLR